MGQKVHPYVLRIGFGKSWKSLWFSGRKRAFANSLEEDIKIKKLIRSSYPKGSISAIIVERVSTDAIRIKIRTSRPGVIIGRRGKDIERIKAEIQEKSGKEVFIDVQEVSNSSLEAQLVAEMIAFQMEKRVYFRRAMKRALSKSIQDGCQGMKIRCSGRLGGLELARSEVYKYGKIPLQTFRSNVDYAYTIARTTYGSIGVKVWIYRGEAWPGSYLNQPQESEEKKTKKEK